jgi:hypothetical protein
MIVAPARVGKRPVSLLFTGYIFRVFVIKLRKHFKAHAVMASKIPFDEAFTVITGKPFGLLPVLGMAVPFTGQHFTVMSIPHVIDKAGFLVFPLYQAKALRLFWLDIIPINNLEGFHRNREFLTDIRAEN